jgi:dTDP-4-dehydrorhamnose reductase
VTRVRVLVAGGAGQVGGEVAPLLPHHDVVALGSAELDVRDRDRVEQVVGELAPDVVVNCSAFTDVDGAETREDAALAVNALGVRNLAVACSRAGAHLVHVSTDYVFDGTKPTPYHEWDPTGPTSAYGRTKLAGELELARHATSWTLVRTAWVFGRRGRNFVDTILGRAEAGDPLRVVDDQRGSPTYAPDLAQALVRLGLGRRQGTFHVTNQGACSWYELARAAVAGVGLDPDVVAAMPSSELDRPAPRPANSVLDNAALRLGGEALLRPWPDALAARLAERPAPAPHPN